MLLQGNAPAGLHYNSLAGVTVQVTAIFGQHIPFQQDEPNGSKPGRVQRIQAGTRLVTLRSAPTKGMLESIEEESFDYH